MFGIVFYKIKYVLAILCYKEVGFFDQARTTNIWFIASWRLIWCLTVAVLERSQHMIWKYDFRIAPVRSSCRISCPVQNFAISGGCMPSTERHVVQWMWSTLALIDLWCDCCGHVKYLRKIIAALLLLVFLWTAREAIHVALYAEHSVGVMSSSGPTCVFTIGAFQNYGLVSSFLERFESLHPELSCFVWVVSDNHEMWFAAKKHVPKKILQSVPRSWRVVTLDQLEPYINASYMELAFRYSKDCLQSAVKPAAFKYIFFHFRARKVVYIDSEAWILKPIVKIIEALEKHSLVFTPHSTEPVNLEITGLEQQQYFWRPYDLSFLGMSGSEAAFRWIDVWMKRMHHYACSDPGLKQNLLHLDRGAWGSKMKH